MVRHALPCHCFVVVVVVAAIVIAELGIHIPKKWILQTLNNSNSSTDDMAHGELGVVEQLYVNSAAGQSPGNSQIILVRKYVHASHTLRRKSLSNVAVGNKMLTSAKHVVT